MSVTNRKKKEGKSGDKLQTSSDCRARVCTVNIHIINIPFTSKPPLYLSQPLSRIRSPRISRNLSNSGLPLSTSNEKRFSAGGGGIDSAIYYQLISHPTRLSFVPADTPDGLTVRQHLVVGGLTFPRVNYAKLEVHRAFLFLEQ